MNEKKEVTKGNINRKRTYQYLSTLWQNVKRKKKYILLYIIIAIIVHMLIDYLATQKYISGWKYLSYQIYYWIANIGVVGVLASKWSGYLEDEKYSKAFQMIGLVNHVGESPIYINQEVKDKNYLTVTFNTVGIAIEKWKEKNKRSRVH